MERNELTRRISLEDDFMRHDQGNDIAYGFLLYLATYDTKTEQLYLTKHKLEKEYNTLRILLSSTSAKETITKKGADKIILKLIESNLLKLGKIDTNGYKDVPCYFFPSDYSSKYRIINNEMLYYIICTRNKCALRIYTYLYDKYLWKQKTKDSYSFTVKELKLALGWGATTKTCEALIQTNLESMAAEGIIEYEEYYTSINSHPVPQKRLTFVAATKDDISYYRNKKLTCPSEDII